ncbi:MAG: hypothetical protein ACLQG5_07915 [Methanobacterium sp.]|jgi:hypothetical protein
MDCVLGILNSICTSRPRDKAFIIVDSTDIQVDLNSKIHKITKESFKDKDIK